MDSRLRDRARTRARHHRSRPARRVLGAVAGCQQPASGSGRAQSRSTDRRHQGRLLRHRFDRHGRQHGDRRLQPRRLRFLDRERQAQLCGERSHHRRPSARYFPHPHIRQRSRIPLRHQCADRAAGGLDRCRAMKRMIPKSGNRFSDKIMRNELAGLRTPLEAVMREAGELARATARGPLKRWTKGDDDSPVSEGDIAVNDLLRARLSDLLPAAGWLSEETEDLPDRALPLAWVVDPIDGTRAYISGRADWTISVALVENGRPVLAALYAPVSDEMFLSLRGKGATRNGAPIAVSGGDTLAHAKLAGPKRYLDRLTGLIPSTLTQPKVFSLALRLARVAHGE